jgi:hypothetical protein
MFLEMAQVDVRSIERAGRLVIEAVPPALIVRDGHGAPFFGLGHSIEAKKRQIKKAVPVKFTHIGAIRLSGLPRWARAG